jgi:hypothetical protein
MSLSKSCAKILTLTIPWQDNSLDLVWSWRILYQHNLDLKKIIDTIDWGEEGG